MKSKEDILRPHLTSESMGFDIIHQEAALEIMEEYAKPYKEIADLISRIFFYGKFRAETHNERILEQKLRDVGLWPTTEDAILDRGQIK